MKWNCQVGDLAIIIDAWNPENIGAIVRVIAAHPDQTALWKEPIDFLWTCVSPQPLTYERDGKLNYRTIGPSPDSRLRPIRGVPLAVDIADGIEFETSGGARVRK